MTLLNRRDLLKFCAVFAPALLMNAVNSSGGSIAESTERYVDPLPRPKRLMPYEVVGGTARYRVRMVEFRQRLHSHLSPTTLWGYEGQYPGPIFDGTSRGADRS